MKHLRLIFNYTSWIVLALSIALVYMYLVLKPNQSIDNDFGFVQEVYLTYGVVLIGVPLGSLIAFFFVLIDSRKIKDKEHTVITRLIKRIFLMMVIALIVFLLHYVAEKVIDVL